MAVNRAVPDAEQLMRLRAEVRTFLAGSDYVPGCDSWMRGFDPGFSRGVAGRGWIGMTWPREYGGSEASNVERLVVLEELLRAGAPLGAHLTGDRQIGPAILRFGSEELKGELLPGICRGESVFCLGLSEPEAGSDLAAVRTRAERVDGGWAITGSKIWTTAAHRATHMYVLARTDASGTRHEGLSEFIVDMGAPGIEVRPIEDLTGGHHFNEVFFDDVFVPDSRVLGTIGDGWAQVMAQLAFERGGPERFLSMHLLLTTMLGVLRRHPDRSSTELAGELAARLVGLRRLALDVARALDRGEAPGPAASELKLLGSEFESDVVEAARYVLEVGDADAEERRVLEEATGAVPASSIRGGSSQIMRTVVSRMEAGR